MYNIDNKSMGDKLQTNYAFLIGTSAICAYILLLLCYYICRRKTLTAPILQILALLLLNELLEAVFEMIPFIEGIGNAACSISLIGKTAFAISASTYSSTQISGSSSSLGSPTESGWLQAST